jgi:hypothetical protein
MEAVGPTTSSLNEQSNGGRILAPEHLRRRDAQDREGQLFPPACDEPAGPLERVSQVRPLLGAFHSMSARSVGTTAAEDDPTVNQNMSMDLKASNHIVSCSTSL